MKKQIITLILSFLIPYYSLIAQDGVSNKSNEENERIAFENTLDSLFLENGYEQIVNLCLQSNKNYLNKICVYNLIGSYYFLGDSVKSWELLNKEISEYKTDAYSMNNLLNKDYASYKKFLQKSSAKNYILNQIDSFYMTEPVFNKEDGIKLLHLLIDDQWVRYISDLYDKFKPERKFLLPSQMDSTQAILAQLDHCTTVFNFYKKHNKIFSKAEVGRIYYWQLMLFFHEWDLERRKFYHKLVIKAVENGVLEMKDRANFEAGTEYIILGVDEFFNRRAELEERYKKKYALPDNYRVRLM